MSSRRVNYSKARSELRRLIEEVHRTGRPVTILRRGKPEAVLVNYEEYERKLAKKAAKPWRLKGSIVIAPDVDIDEGIREHRKEMRDALEARLATYRRTLRS